MKMTVQMMNTEREDSVVDMHLDSNACTDTPVRICIHAYIHAHVYVLPMMMIHEAPCMPEKLRLAK